MNWFAITIISIWICATIGAGLTNDSECFSAAMIVTIAMGIGYFWLHGLN